MPIEVLRLNTLGNLARGFAGAAVEEALAQVARDLAERPGLAGKRRIVIRLDFSPADDALGVCEECLCEMAVDVKLPAQKRASALGVNPTGALTFRADSPEDVKQTTFRDVPRQGDETHD